MRPHVPAALLALSCLALGACDRSRQAPDVVAATRLAYALEDTVAAHWEGLTHRDSVLAIFSRGFEPDVAARLTDRTWSAELNALVGSELSIAAPDSVVVRHLAGDSAEVAFVTPVAARWDAAMPYTIAWLRRRAGVWRVGGSRDTSVAPAPLPPPVPGSATGFEPAG